MLDEWGRADGDHEANIIIRDRRAKRRSLATQALVLNVLLVIFAIWYGAEAKPAALSALIILAVWRVSVSDRIAIFETGTLVLVAERRAQLLEQKVQDIQMDMPR